VLYFICPASGQLCRILYKGYDSRIWKSRQAYQNRIYYPTQKASRYNYFCERYWELDSQLQKLAMAKRTSKTYKGKPTRKAQRIKRLKEEHRLFDRLMFSPAAMPLGLRSALYGHLPNYGL
jgi:hypothetical protein